MLPGGIGGPGAGSPWASVGALRRLSEATRFLPRSPLHPRGQCPRESPAWERGRLAALTQWKVMCFLSLCPVLILLARPGILGKLWTRQNARLLILGSMVPWLLDESSRISLQGKASPPSWALVLLRGTWAWEAPGGAPLFPLLAVQAWE